MKNSKEETNAVTVHNNSGITEKPEKDTEISLTKCRQKWGEKI